jgi:uncharacterized membrane protein
VKLVLQWVLAALMSAAGILHFVKPQNFTRIVPKYLPYPLALVYISGFFEILGGVGLLIEPVRIYAAWGLIALYIAVFPANIYMATEKISFPGLKSAQWILWARLPLQVVLIAWAHWYTY